MAISASLAPGLPPVDEAARIVALNALGFVFFVLGAIAVLLASEARLRTRAESWSTGREAASPESQRLVSELPVRLTRVSARVWTGAVLVFPTISLSLWPKAVVFDLVAITLGGVICCGCVYLRTERSVRPLAAAALGGVPLDGEPETSLANRLAAVWTLTAAVPLVAVGAMVASELAGTGVEPSTRLAVLLLLGGAIAAGWWATTALASSIADPIDDLRRAMGSVRDGQLDRRIVVDDCGELGQLQAGFNHMAAGLSERERLRDVFARQVGSDVAERALAKELRLGGEERWVAVLFVDMIGSTELAARQPAAAVVETLNRLFAVVVGVVSLRGGSINKFLGDGALCVFGGAGPTADSSSQALAAARGLISELERLLPGTEVAIGVAAGDVVAGNIGAHERFEFTVVGDAVNEASRLCDLAKRGRSRVLASDVVWKAAARTERARWSPAGAASLRGRPERTNIFRPRGPWAERSFQQADFREEH